MSPGSSMSDSSMMGRGQESSKDMARMCAHHQEMMAGKTPEEQQAMMKSMHGSADPQQMARHRQMMEQKCGTSAR